MIRFDVNSIYNRLTEKLKQDPNWKVVLNNSVISSILSSNAEVTSEIARYAEYLFRESKWDTAQNPSSIISMANLLGYQPARKISATGYIKVSLDPRIHIINKLFPENLSNNLKNPLPKEVLNRLGSLNWKTTNIDFTIPPTALITDDENHKYIAATPTKYTKSSNSNGYLNPYFTDLQIIQGERKEIILDKETIRKTYTYTTLDPYLYIPVVIDDCEDARSPLSKSFFKVILLYANQGNISEVEYRVVDSLLLSEAGDLDVEVYNDFYSQNLFYLKFSNDDKKGSKLDLSNDSNLVGIKIQYIKTSGEKGNVEEFKRFKIENVPINYTNKTERITLYGLNTSSISGGKESESILDIKENAPKFYIKNYTAGTKESYENTIKSLSIPAGERILIPSKVNVYSGITENNKSVTCVSFIAKGLDDILGSSNLEEISKDINNNLNTMLYNLKSPQDTIEFRPPEYIPIAVNINIEKENQAFSSNTFSEDIDISSKVVNYIFNQWGHASEKLDFNRNFIPSYIKESMKEEIPELKGVGIGSIDVEPLQKLNWLKALSIESTKSVLGGSNIKYHTIRIGYSFPNEFIEFANKNFEENINNTYLLRIDLIYKNPGNSRKENYGVSIFTERSNKDDISIYGINSSNNIWDVNSFKGNTGSYSDLAESTVEAKITRQISLNNCTCVCNRESYSNLFNSNDIKTEQTQNEYNDRSIDSQFGLLKDYLIYIKLNKGDDNSAYLNKEISPVTGWIEFGFESLYSILNNFKMYDANLASRLSKCEYSSLQCGLDNNTSFEIFKSILNDYVDIYVSLMPRNDYNNIILQKDEDTVNIRSSESKTPNNKVIYIDSGDISSFKLGSHFSPEKDLNGIKKSRMISVSIHNI